MVAFFLRMSNEGIVARYCHLNPRVDPEFLAGLLAEPAEYLRWAGTDLFCTTTATGRRRLVVLETNSCPSGNKSMPPLSDDNEQAGYRSVIERAFVDNLKKRGGIDGDLAVLFDKNHIEASAYACAISDQTGEPVHLAPLPDAHADPPARFNAGVLEVRLAKGRWRQIRAAFRYVTQRPWSRIPVRTRTRILNPVVACLAGGRNKLIASKAYDLMNAKLAGSGLRVRMPPTIVDVSKPEVPLVVARFGGQAVIKIPYSNAGQGVFTILSRQELDKFMEADYGYDRFVVQSLIGNYGWGSMQEEGRFYHVGTMPNRFGQIFVADLRVMVCSGQDGFRPVAVYARRAQHPLPHTLDSGADSWAFLGTNLSTKLDDGSWAADTNRLLLMDRKDFNRIGIGSDDLIEAYIQSVLATKAIDEMAKKLLTKKGGLRYKLFGSLDEDPALLEEIRAGAAGGIPMSGKK
ncbi:MAG: hypothetical protein OER80_14785 [Gammaproteobacteria bacterium]|nr:hypothetical protein [Gammaproteobacteria bacterium]